MNRILLASLLVFATASSVASDRPSVMVRGATCFTETHRSDAYCSDGVYCNGTERCAPGNPAADERGCVPGAPPCREGERCNEVQDRCHTIACEVPDADGDGHTAIACGGDDCDDTDPDRSPSLTEICDAQGNDEDCDTSTVGDRDDDGDGFIDARCL